MTFFGSQLEISAVAISKPGDFSEYLDIKFFISFGLKYFTG